MSISKGERKGLNPSSYLRVYSADNFLPASYSTPASIPGNDFFAAYTALKVAVLSNGTKIRIDTNNDGFFDSEVSHNRGVHQLSTIEGARIKSSKNIAIYADLNGVLFALLPSSSIGSDYFETGGYALALFSNETGFSQLTEFKIYSQNNSILKTTLYAAPNTKASYQIPHSHIVSSMPSLNTALGSGGHSSISINSNPYSQIYLTHYSKNKYISNAETNTFIVRIFNPFLNEEARDISLYVAHPANFTPLAGIIVERKSLKDDAILASASAIHPGTGDGFSLSHGDSPILSRLQPMEYLEIRYDLITPDYLGTFEFPSARMTYSADTWIIS